MNSYYCQSYFKIYLYNESLINFQVLNYLIARRERKKKRTIPINIEKDQIKREWCTLDLDIYNM